MSQSDRIRVKNEQIRQTENANLKNEMLFGRICAERVLTNSSQKSAQSIRRTTTMEELRKRIVSTSCKLNCCKQRTKASSKGRARRRRRRSKILETISISLLVVAIQATVISATSDAKDLSQYKIAHHVIDNNNNNLGFITGQQHRHNLISRNLFWPSSSDTTATSTATSAPLVPEFQEPIGNHTVAVGRDAQLACKISNLGSYRTAWLRVEDKGILTIHNNIITRNYRIGLVNTDSDDGTSNGFVLHIKNVQPSDKGGYMCQINSVPMKYAIGYLDVLTPPQFDLDASGAVTTTVAPGDSATDPTTSGVRADGRSAASSASVSVVEGSNATLSCQASGHPAPIITWRREDGQPILLNGPDADGVQKVDGVNTLTLPKVHRLNAGPYLCIASNGVQPSASKRQVLDVKYSPTITVAQTEVGVALLPVPASNQQQAQQQRALISCIVELNPLGTYHWFKLAASSKTSTAMQADDAALMESGDDELSNSDKYEIVIKLLSSEKVQMQLSIRKLDRTDMAQYKCIARNTIGYQSSSIRLYEVPGGPRTSGLLITNNNSNNNGDDQMHLNDQSDGGAPSQTRTGSGGDKNNRAHTRSSWLVHGGRSAANSQQPGNGNRWQQSSAQSSTSSSAAATRGARLAQVPGSFVAHLPAIYATIALIASLLSLVSSTSSTLLSPIIGRPILVVSSR